MPDFKQYRKKNTQSMRQYIPGEDLAGISVSENDTPGPGGMIAVAASDQNDKWYVNKNFFEANYEEAN